MKEINDVASEYYEKQVKVMFRAESPVVFSAWDGSVIAEGGDVPLEIIQLLEMSRCLHAMLYEFESKNRRRGTPPTYGMFSLSEIVEATGAEWLPGDGDIYFTRHAEIPLANGKRLYLRQGDDPEDRECRVLDDAPKLQSGLPLWEPQSSHTPADDDLY